MHGSILVNDLQLNGGQILVRQDLNGPTSLGNLTLTDDAGATGRFAVGRDWNGPLFVQGDIALIGGELNTGRDWNGGSRIEGDLAVLQGGSWAIGRNLNQSIRVRGNLDLSGGWIRSQVVSMPPGTDVMIVQTGGPTPGGDGAVEVEGTVTP